MANPTVKYPDRTEMLQRRWSELKEKVKERWEKITDDDLTTINGKQDELVSFLQLRYGYTMEQAHRDIESWLSSMDKASGTAQASA